MTEFAPEDFFGVEGGGREAIEQLSDAFLVAGEGVLDEDLDDDPIEPSDV